MISGGNASIYVSDMDRAVEFYTQVVGLTLKVRVGSTWAELDAGKGFVVGLHPSNDHSVPPGTSGAVNVELNVTEPMEKVRAELERRGVAFDGPIQEYEAVRIATFEDPDGNTIVLGEVLITGD